MNIMQNPSTQHANIQPRVKQTIYIWINIILKIKSFTTRNYGNSSEFETICVDVIT